MATVIASQAVITGAYSVTRQAIQLGLIPRLTIRHTSETQEGQIYIPRANTAMLVGVLLLVAIFRTSEALASAYGIAVTTTMVVDGILGFIVIWKAWGWRPLAAAAVMLPLVLVDSTFLCANLLKIVEGAWAPLALGAAIVLIVLTWRRGTLLLAGKTRQSEVPLDKLVASLERNQPHLVPGTAVFLTSDPNSAPTSLLHNLKHNKVLHEHNVVLTITTANTPKVPDDDRVRMTQISTHFAKVEITFGFMETPNIPRALAIARKQGWRFRHHVDVLLPVPPCAEAGGSIGHASLAGPTLHRAREVRERCNRLLSNTDGTGRRNRHSGHHLSHCSRAAFITLE